MNKETIGFRVSNERKQALEELSARMGTNMSETINNAIDHYIDIQQWQIDTIAQRLHDVTEGNIAPLSQAEAFDALTAHIHKGQ